MPYVLFNSYAKEDDLTINFKNLKARNYLPDFKYLINNCNFNYFKV